MMAKALNALFNSRPWLVLSIACALFALYEGGAKILTGHEFEGLSDLVLFIVLVVNFLNRFKIIGGYVERLRD
jgi:hypothetical protein